LQVWHADTWDLLCAVPSKGFATTAVDPEGWQIAVGVQHEVTLYDVRPLTPELRLQREAHHLVAALLNRPMLKPRPPLLKAEVMARLRDLKSISDEVRQECMALVEGIYDEKDQCLHFQFASQDIVEKTGQSEGKYRQALAWAQTACRLDP